MTQTGKENRKRRYKARRKTGFHRGGSVKERNPGIERYLHSKQDGKWRRDRQTSVEQLILVLNRIEKRRKKNEKVIIVGTTEDLGRRREKLFANVEGNPRILVSRTWISGILTNYTKFQNDRIRWKQTPDERKSVSEKRWYEKHRKGRENFAGRDRSLMETSSDQGRKRKKGSRPGRIRFRNPKDHRRGRKESLRCGVPTAGILNTNLRMDQANRRERRTYPIPGNDQSRLSQRTLRRRRKNLVVQDLNQLKESPLRKE